MNWMKRTKIIVALSTMLIAGCGMYQATNEIPGSPLERVPAATLNIAPAKAVAAIQQAIVQPPLSLTVDSAQDGVVVTGWKEYEGTIHIVRRWPERTRYYIVVNPDFNDPGHRCRVLVYDQTQEKAEERQGFVDNSQLYRRSRADEVLHAIEQAIPASAPAGK